MAMHTIPICHLASIGRTLSLMCVCISNHTRPTGNQSRAEAPGPGAHIELSVNPLALIDVQRRKLTPPLVVLARHVVLVIIWRHA
jgi:hypothetical protein